MLPNRDLKYPDKQSKRVAFICVQVGQIRAIYLHKSATIVSNQIELIDFVNMYITDEHNAYLIQKPVTLSNIFLLQLLDRP